MATRKIAEVIQGQQILTAAGGLTVLEASQQMKSAHVGSIMVVDSGRLVGIFTERDALNRVLAERRDPETTVLAEVMTANPQTIDPERPLGHAMHLMNDGGFRHVPVVKDGRPVGMISARDALGVELTAFEHELKQRESISELL
ncbi:MAG: CBS domain-containing protein [Thauera sp.]|nr:CBS domain-containing protein [Thauera sp.]